MDRITIILLVTVGFALLWLVWQLYKARTLNSIEVDGIAIGKPNLLYFSGPYCTACKFQQTPVVEAIISKFGDSIAVRRYDVSAFPELASRYKVLTLPTTIVVSEQGRVAHINRGIAALEQLETQLQP